MAGSFVCVYFLESDAKAEGALGKRKIT